jgi:cyclin-dependent kinase 7
MQFLKQIKEDKNVRYERSGKPLGEGTFGIVYRGVDRETGQVVAVKKIRMGKSENGVAFSALREIKVLQELKHDNVIELMDVFIHKSNVFLVYEFLDTDLHQIIEDKTIVLSPSDVKGYMRSILEGMASCHTNWVLHRDMKPSNILVSRDGKVKLADFGLAKVFGSPDKRYSPQCVTLWYKPPELLFGANLYGPSVDMWSVGCIFAELMLRRAFLPGQNDLDQLGKIFAILGTPTDQDWPQMRSLPNFIEFEEFPRTPLKQIFLAATDDALNMLSRMLSYDPNKRITAQDALLHPYFVNDPKPSQPSDLPMPRKVFESQEEQDTNGTTTVTNGRGGRASKVLVFADNEDLNASLNTSILSSFSNDSSSVNFSGMMDDDDMATPSTVGAGSEKRRRADDDNSMQDDEEDMDGERPSVRRKLAL